MSESILWRFHLTFALLVPYRIILGDAVCMKHEHPSIFELIHEFSKPSLPQQWDLRLLCNFPGHCICRCSISSRNLCNEIELEMITQLTSPTYFVRNKLLRLASKRLKSSFSGTSHHKIFLTFEKYDFNLRNASLRWDFSLLSSSHRNQSSDNVRA